MLLYIAVAAELTQKCGGTIIWQDTFLLQKTNFYGQPKTLWGQMPPILPSMIHSIEYEPDIMLWNINLLLIMLSYYYDMCSLIYMYIVVNLFLLWNTLLKKLTHGKKYLTHSISYYNNSHNFFNHIFALYIKV